MEIKEKISNLTDQLNDDRYNYLIIPIAVLNILDQDNRFLYSDFKGEVVGITKIGNFMWYEVYLDILMPPDEIIVYCDRAITRNNKIDFLLNDDELLKEKRINLD
jgi:hypothetical protein